LEKRYETGNNIHNSQIAASKYVTDAAKFGKNPF